VVQGRKVDSTRYYHTARNIISGQFSVMGNQALAQPADYRPWPGFRHPCRNDSFSRFSWLVYNGKGRSLGTS